MKRQALLRWQRGGLSVIVELDGSDLTISRKQDDLVEELVSVPASRSLLLALQEACTQALRGMQAEPLPANPVPAKAVPHG